MYASFGVIESGASPPILIPTLPIRSYVAIDIDYIGEKVKLSELPELEVRLSVRKETNANIEILFTAGIPFGTTESESQGLTYGMQHLGVALVDDSETGGSEQIVPYTGRLRITSNYGDDDFEDYTDPESVDSFGEKAKILTCKVDLSKLAGLEGKLKTGIIESCVFTGYDLNLKEWKYMGYGSHKIHFFTDGEYIAFSQGSPEAAQRLILGDFDYFRKIAVPEFFDGIDEFFRYTVPRFFYSCVGIVEE